MSWAIVALPEKNDPVWKLSSEKQPHLTLLFLGEPTTKANTELLIEFVEHLATTAVYGFGLEVDHRGVLGDDLADVLFFRTDGYGLDSAQALRHQLLQNSEVLKAYASVEQYPVWIPHLTLGYPKTPAKEGVDDPTWIYFDRLAVWTSQDDGPTFELKRYNYMEVSHRDDVDEFFLAHFGVKGMRWGVRRNAASATSTSSNSLPTRQELRTMDKAARSRQKAARKAEAEARDQAILDARARRKETLAAIKTARAQYKNDRRMVGKIVAREIFDANVEKPMAGLALAAQVTRKEETQRLVARLTTIALTSITKA